MVGSARVVGVLSCAIVLGCSDDRGTGGTTGDGSTGVAATGTSAMDSTGSASTTSAESESSDGTNTDTGGIVVDPAPPTLAATRSGACEVRDDHSLWCWGEIGCAPHPVPPTSVGASGEWQSVSMGYDHQCAIKTDDSLWCWGVGLHGKVGTGELYDVLDACVAEPTEIDAGSAWARVAVGEDHTCGIQTDGSLWCWGSNEAAQIGDGSVGPLYARLAPARVGEDQDWVDVAAGEENSCGLTVGGEVWCWGTELGDGSDSWSSVPVPSLLADVVSFSRGTADRTCAIDSDGGLWCFGVGGGGALGNGGEDDAATPVQAILPAPAIAAAVGTYNTCAVLDDGTLWCAGRNNREQLLIGPTDPLMAFPTPLQVGTLDAWAHVAVGAWGHVCARDGAAQSWCWGENYDGQSGAGTSGSDNTPVVFEAQVGGWIGGMPSSGWTAVSIGWLHGCGLRDDDTAWCWGHRFAGALGTGDPVDDCSIAGSSSCHFTVPHAVAATPGWTTLEAGGSTTCGIRPDGSLWCWGSNSHGAVGDGSGMNVEVPVQIGTVTDWTVIAGSPSTMCGIHTGELWCWGDGFWGQLGDGMVDVAAGSPVPQQVGLATDWDAVAAGDRGTCAIRSGELYCWGANDFGQIGDGTVSAGPNVPADVTKPDPTLIGGGWTRVAVGRAHACAIADDGSLSCWGSNDEGQLGDGAGGRGALASSPALVGSESDWIDVAAGDSSTCGVRENGTAWCWGDDRDGQLGIGGGSARGFVDTPTQVGSETDWVDVSLQGSTACGLRQDVPHCWGANETGRQGNDTIFPGASPRQVIDDP